LLPFPALFHNNTKPVSNQLSSGTASTFVLTANTGSSNNAKSLVLMIEHEDFTVVFTGDAEGPTEAQAITNFSNAVKATVLTTSHHGASTLGSNSAASAEATSPELLVSSAGNRFSTPDVPRRIGLRHWGRRSGIRSDVGLRTATLPHGRIALTTSLR